VENDKGGIMALKEIRKVKTRFITPKLYKVIFLNDNFTTFDFVIEVLKCIFHKKEQEAIDLTYKIDREGSAVVGIYPYEIAKEKIDETHNMARSRGFPLRAKMEEA
jgi:ATP-dependent Clp protease adaptor protein ClpS